MQRPQTRPQREREEGDLRRKIWQKGIFSVLFA
jgi:hypothetical protein